MIGVTPWKKPGTVAQVASGFYEWLNLQDLLADDADTGTIGAYVAGVTHSYKVMRLLKDGTLSGTDKGTPLVSVDYTSPDSWGGSSDLWGNTLVKADVEDVDFGYALEYANQSTGNSVSYRINASNFGFTLPAGATVTGIETRVSYAGFAGGGGTTGIALYEMEMRVHYTFNPTVTAVGTAVATAYVRGREPVESDKKFRFLIYDSGRQYIGDVTKYVVNEPSFKQQLNTLHSNMPLTLAQNEQSTETTVDTWVNETPESIVTEAGDDILFDLAAAVGLGPGSNVEVNNEVDVKAYYGAFHEWVTETGEPIITDDGELIMFEDGAPLGRNIFTGYLSQWELLFGDGENVTANLLSHSKELDNIMLETEDTVAFTHGSAVGGSSYGIAGGGPSDYETFAQVFRYTGATGARGRLRFYGWPGWGVDIPVSVAVYTGTNPNSLGTFVTSMTGFIEADPDNFRANTFIDLYFDPATFTNGSDYTLIITTTESKTGGNPTYPANFYAASSDVANGQLYYATKSTPYTAISGADLWFEIYTLGGETTRTFNSTDPSQILKYIIDFARLRGARVNYDNSTIEPTGTLVSITFKTNTISEAIAAVLKTAPADWYYYYDYGNNMLHFHPRPTSPAHYYTKGRDVVKLKIKRTIERLINDVYFTGGGSPTPLFIRKTDQSRINQWRRGLSKQSDNRVTVQATGEILAQADIDQFGDALYSGDLQLVRVEDFRLEDVTVGELSGFISFGALVDALELQNMSLTYHPDYLDIVLDILTPPVPKRIEDIKRNLAELEHANDPTSPTIT